MSSPRVGLEIRGKGRRTARGRRLRCRRCEPVFASAEPLRGFQSVSAYCTFLHGLLFVKHGNSYRHRVFEARAVDQRT